MTLFEKIYGEKVGEIEKVGSVSEPVDFDKYISGV